MSGGSVRWVSTSITRWRSNRSVGHRFVQVRLGAVIRTSGVGCRSGRRLRGRRSRRRGGRARRGSRGCAGRASAPGVRIHRSTLAKRNGTDGSDGRRSTGWSRYFVVAAGDELRVRRGSPGVERRSGRDARGDEQVDRLVEVGPRRPRRRARRRARRGGRADRGVASVGIGRPVGSTEQRRTSADHWLVGRRPSSTSHCSGVSVAYTPCGAAHGLRLPSRSSALPYAVHSIDQLGGDVERGFEHRRLDQAADPGPVARLEREQRRRTRRACRRSGRTGRAGSAAGRRRGR